MLLDNFNNDFVYSMTGEQLSDATVQIVEIDSDNGIQPYQRDVDNKTMFPIISNNDINNMLSKEITM
jgi:hypothetical protein